MTLDLPLIIDELRSISPYCKDDVGLILRRNIARLCEAKEAADKLADEGEQATAALAAARKVGKGRAE